MFIKCIILYYIIGGGRGSLMTSRPQSLPHGPGSVIFFSGGRAPH